MLRLKKIRWSETIRKPPWFLRVETYTRKKDHLVPAAEEAHYPRIVPLVVMDYGNLPAKLKSLKYVGKLGFLALYEMWKGVRSIRKNPYAGQKNIDAATLKEMEAYAESLGACDFGYTKVNRQHIYKGFKLLFSNAIVFTIEMDRLKMKKAPSSDSLHEVYRTYYQIGLVVNKVSKFLRDRGYNAQPGHAIGGEVNYIPLAIDAGLGYSGKNGLLITRKNGPRIRLAAIYTDIENLPFATENPHKWVKDYCDECNNCVKKCPADAIFMETKYYEDGWPHFIDHTKCAAPFSNDNGCSLCIKYCPFTYSTYEKIKESYEKQDQQSIT